VLDRSPNPHHQGDWVKECCPLYRNTPVLTHSHLPSWPSLNYFNHLFVTSHNVEVCLITSSMNNFTVCFITPVSIDRRRTHCSSRTLRRPTTWKYVVWWRVAFNDIACISTVLLWGRCVVAVKSHSIIAIHQHLIVYDLQTTCDYDVTSHASPGVERK